ncbi:MAG: ABC transporter permease [Solirubrobacterales bacterium]
MAAIALRNLWARRLRTFLTALAVVLGVMMIAGTYVLTDTIDRSFDEIFTESNEGIDAVVSTKEVVELDDGSLPPFDASLLGAVRKTPGVEEAEGSIADTGVAIIGEDGERVGVGGAPSLAFSAGLERFDPLTYAEGGPPQSDDEVVIDFGTAENEGFEVGDRVTLSGRAGTRAYTVSGLGKLGDAESLGGATFAVLTLAEAQRITGKQGEFDVINVAAEPGTSADRLKANLEAALPDSVKAETGEENTEAQKQDIDEGIGFLQTALLIFAGVALFVASFLIFNTFSITVAQRTREFAMLRTLGANRRQLIVSVMTEAFAIGLLGSALGLLAGIGFSSVLEALFDALQIDLPAAGTVVASRTVIVSLVLGTTITVISALLPALRATRVPPVAGLREGAVLSTPRQHRIRAGIGTVLALLGIALMALGLFGIADPGELALGAGAVIVFIGVALLSPWLVPPLAALVGKPLERLRGTPGRIAYENTVRNPGRTAATAAALMIGLALVSFVAIFAAGLKGSIDDAIDETITADLYLANSDGFSDIPAAAADTVGGIEGVELAAPLRYTQYAKPDGSKGGFLTLLGTEGAADVLELDWRDGGSDELLTGMGPNDAVLDEGFAGDKGLEAGDEFSVLTASGQQIDYTVTGTFKDKTDFIGDYAASDANAGAYGEGDNATNVLVKLGDGVDTDAVRGQIEEAVEQGFPTIEVQNQQELKDSIGEQLNQLLGGVYGLLFLAVIVSLFGIVNTLALSIHERTRELGLLRAVGTSRRQVRRIVRYEAVITALIGAVLGAALGVIFAVLVSRPLAEEGFTLTIPVGTLLVLLVLAALAGVLAAIGPARRASRLDVLQALSYE